MFARGLAAFCLSLLMESAMEADGFVTLTATTPEEPTGGYPPGTIVDFDVSMTQDTGSDILIQLVTLNFEETDQALTLIDPFDFNCEIIHDCALVAVFPNYADPMTAALTVEPLSGFAWVLPATGTGSWFVGSGRVQLPTTPGNYLLDALNENIDPDPEYVRTLGPQIRFWFDPWYKNPHSQWFVRDIPDGEGVIFGDPLALTVIPEPATLALLALGGLVTLPRRRVKRWPAS